MNSSLKSMWPRSIPIAGMTMSFTNETTIAPNAAPMITATARSRTLPFITNALNSLSMLEPFFFLVWDLSCDGLLLLLRDDLFFDLGVDCGREDLLVDQLVLALVWTALDDLVAVSLAYTRQCAQLFGRS